MKDFFERYADRIKLNPANGCWEWQGARSPGPQGYGHFRWAGRERYAHRTAYEWMHGVGAADGLIVRHRCDNPPCCNPAHLLGGSQAENMADMRARGRGNPVRGADVNTAKVTDGDVLLMRRLAAQGWSVARIAALFPLTHGTVSCAVMGRTWKHLAGAVANPVKDAAPPPVARGERNPTALLAEHQVREIKRRLRGGDVGRALAREFGVSRSTISAIKAGRNWSHVA